MPTVHRARRFRFVIFTDDHQPAHIHAIAPDGEAKIELGSLTGGPSLIWVRGALGAADVRFALAEVTREQAALRDAWRRIHGEDAQP